MVVVQLDLECTVAYARKGTGIWMGVLGGEPLVTYIEMLGLNRSNVIRSAYHLSVKNRLTSQIWKRSRCSRLFSTSHQEDPTCPICVQWLRVKSLQRLIEDHSSSTVFFSRRYGNIIQERHLSDLIRYLSWYYHRIYTCWGGRCKLLSQWQDVGNHITGVFTWL